MQRRNGFTLIELIMVVAIIAIIALIATPGLQGLLRFGGMTSASNDLLGALQLARSEAVIRRTGVTACPSTDGATCASGTDWSLGGVIKLTNSTEVLRVIPPAKQGVVISGNKIDYRGNGTSTGSTLTISHPDGGSRTVKVNLIGQACGGDSCS